MQGVVDPDPYYELIEEAFMSSKKRGLFLSPSDWLMIEVFSEKHIPAAVVIKGINEVVEKRGHVGSLKTCKKSVFKAWEVEKETGVGKRKKFDFDPSQDAIDRLVRISDYLQLLSNTNGLSDNLPLFDFIKQIFHEIDGILDNIREDGIAEIERIEESLKRMEKELTEMLFEQMNEKDKNKIRSMAKSFYMSVEKEISPSQKDKFYEIIWFKCARDFFKMPRFSII